MAHRKAFSEKNNFATQLAKLGFEQIGDCTFVRDCIKIFRTNKSNSERLRYWEVQELCTGRVFYKSNHTREVIEYLEHTQFLGAGAFLQVRFRRDGKKLSDSK